VVGVVALVLQSLLFVGYPLAVYLSYTRLDTRRFGLVLLSLYALSVVSRFKGSWAEVASLARQHVPLALVIALAVVSGSRTLLLLLPVAVSLYLLWTFSSSLRAGPSIVERFARAVDPDLPDFVIPYCRKVTLVWCGFFVWNSLCVVILATTAPIEWWALYTGLVAYLLMGVLFAGELVVRKLWFRRYQDGLLDRIFALLFPAQRTANGRRSLAHVEALRSRTGGHSHAE
jgi:uncharacterized membrane protein